MASGKENIARNVSNYMQIFDINQVQLAEALNCSNTTVSMWIRGNSFPRIEKIDAMCEIFGCTRADLLADKIKTPEQARQEKLQNVFIRRFKKLSPEQQLDLLSYMDSITSKGGD